MGVDDRDRPLRDRVGREAQADARFAQGGNLVDPSAQIADDPLHPHARARLGARQRERAPGDGERVGDGDDPGPVGGDRRVGRHDGHAAPVRALQRARRGEGPCHHVTSSEPLLIETPESETSTEPRPFADVMPVLLTVWVAIAVDVSADAV